VKVDTFGLRSGFKLFREGLGDSTLRDLRVPTRWRGLTADDNTILSAWLGSIGDDVRELHTDVPVGLVPVLEHFMDDPFMRNQIASNHPLRIDACVRRSDGWFVCEVKPDAGYKALGQILCYLFWAARCLGGLTRASGVVVTDRCQEAVRPLFAEFQIEVVEVGRVLLDR